MDYEINIKAVVPIYGHICKKGQGNEAYSKLNAMLTL